MTRRRPGASGRRRSRERRHERRSRAVPAARLRAAPYEDVGGGELYCDTCGLAPVVVGATGMRGLAADRRRPARRARVGLAAAPRHRAPLALLAYARPRSRRSPPGARCPGGCRARCPGRSDGAARCRCAAPAPSAAGSGRGRLGRGPGAPCRTCRGPTRAPTVLDDPEVPERKRFCSRARLRGAGGPRARRPAGPHGGLLHQVRPPVLVRAEAAAPATWCTASTRWWAAWRTAGSAGSTWPWTARSSDRWVVLKGLLDTGDEDAMAAAISERRFLAEIEHPNIVRIYNFVEHLDQRTGSPRRLHRHGVRRRQVAQGDRQRAPHARTAGAIRCRSSRRARTASRRWRRSAICTAATCSTATSRSTTPSRPRTSSSSSTWARCAGWTTTESAIYGTVGYQAPEVAEVGPSVASDLYTVARTLAVLTFDFQGYTNVFVDRLPDPDNIEVFRQYESFYRLLVRATDPDPARRFASAQEMAEQLTGVLREVVALQTGRPRPALSTLFGPELRVADTELFAERRPARCRGSGARGRRAARGDGPRHAARRPPLRPAAPAVPQRPGGRPLTAAGQRPPDCRRAAALALPVPRVDPADPNAGFLAGPAGRRARRAARRAARPRRPTPSETAAAAGARPAGERRRARPRARRCAGWRSEHPDDWRVVWYRGRGRAGHRRPRDRRARPSTRSTTPSPASPRPSWRWACARRCWASWTTPPSTTAWCGRPTRATSAPRSAWPGCSSRPGTGAGAVRTLESVPESSIHYTAARVAAVRARLRGRARRSDDRCWTTCRRRRAGGGAGARTVWTPARREQLSTEVLGSALDWVLSGRPGRRRRPRAGRPRAARQRPGRAGAALRPGALVPRAGPARASGGEERIELVERANRYRPRTWV